MTFLNPVVLLGLAASAIPLILHLLNLRKLRTIEFSSLRFLKELQQTKIRRLKLRQIILLIIRTLIIIFIVLTFARPTLKGTLFGSAGERARSTMVIILDNTFSMSVSDTRGERFRQAKDAALRITEMLRDGDEAFLIRLSEIPGVTIDPATHDIEFIKKIINESEVSAVQRPLDDALLTSAKLLSKSSNANKEIYVITDRQQTQFSSAKNLEQPSAQFSPQTHLFMLPVGSETVPNVSIDSLSVISTILEKEKPVSLFVSVKNWSHIPLNNYVLSAYINGKKSAQNSINIDPWSTGSLEISVTPQQSGSLSGYVELEDDAIDTDNRRYFSLTIPEETNIVFFTGTANDSRFLRSALNARNSQDVSILNTKDVLPSKLQYFDFKTADVIISVNFPSFDDDACRKIKDYITGGGGFIIFPGSGMDIENYNRNLFPKLGIPPAEMIIGNKNQPTNMVFQTIDFDHPLFSTIFESPNIGPAAGNPGIESPLITTALVRKADKKSRTIITMSDGSPGLSEHNLGSGRILFFSVAASLDWSDFPVNGIFAPLIYRSVLYASPKQELNSSAIVGDNVILPVYPGKVPLVEIKDAAPYKLVAPDKVEEILHPITPDAAVKKTGATTYLPIRSISQPGIYEVRKSGELISLLTANTYPPESDPRLANEDEQKTFSASVGLQSSNIHIASGGEGIEASILQFRYGIELWRYCVIIALILALTEIIIARSNKEKTPGEQEPKITG